MSDLFKDAVVAGIPLLVVVIGFVQYIKGFGLSGTVVKVLSLGVGTLLGIGYKFSTVPLVDFAGWFAAVVFGLALGLLASGVYEVANPPTK